MPISPQNTVTEEATDSDHSESEDECDPDVLEFADAIESGLLTIDGMMYSFSMLIQCANSV